MSITRISSEFQVAIPESILVKLDTKPGQDMMVSERDGGIILTPLPLDPVAYLCGIMCGGSTLTKELVLERSQENDRE